MRVIGVGNIRSAKVFQKQYQQAISKQALATSYLLKYRHLASIYKLQIVKILK